MSSRSDSIWLSTEGFLGTAAFRVVLWVVEEVLVVPVAVVCACPAYSAETSASVASVFSWIFIWPLSLLFNRSATHDRARRSLWHKLTRRPSPVQGNSIAAWTRFAPVRFAVACEHLKNLA